MLDYLLYTSVRALSFFVCLFPIEFSLFWARAVGTILYYLLPKRARICYLNLKLAFGDCLSIRKRKRIIQAVFRNLAMNFAELLYFPKINADYLRRHVKIMGKDKIVSVLEKKRGLIFLTGHFGSWELSSLVGGAQGYPMVVLARTQKFPRLNSLLNSYRERFGSRVISRGSLMRELLSSLRNNRVVGILADQKAGTTGTLVDFFARLAWTPTGAITLAQHTGARILPVFMIREKGPFHRIEIGNELLSGQDNVRPLNEFNSLLEEYVRKYPVQWLWFHRRWKASPNKNILILSDGKAGHLNQARTVAGLIKAHIGERGKGLRVKVQGELVKVKEMEVKFRNRFTKRPLNLGGLCASRKCVGCLRCLKLCLEKESYAEINSFYADIVISCGGNLAGLNLILAKENQAKSIVIMKPGLVPVKRFDLAIIPAHDRPKLGNNIVITQAALNLIDEQTMREGMLKLQTSNSMLRTGKKKIGVLIGGESKTYTLTKEIANTVIDELLKVAKDLDAQLLVTTSRRTSVEVDNLVKENLSAHPLCPLLIIAHENNIEGAVAGILGLSDIVVVSGESISMISEALGSQKPVLVFEPQKKRKIKNIKHDRFLDNLIRQNYLSLVKPQELSGEIKRVYRNPTSTKSLKDRELVLEAIRKII